MPTAKEGWGGRVSGRVLFACTPTAGRFGARITGGRAPRATACKRAGALPHDEQQHGQCDRLVRDLDLRAVKLCVDPVRFMLDPGHAQRQRRNGATAQRRNGTGRGRGQEAAVGRGSSRQQTACSTGMCHARAVCWTRGNVLSRRGSSKHPRARPGLDHHPLWPTLGARGSGLGGRAHGWHGPAAVGPSTPRAAHVRGRLRPGLATCACACVHDNHQLSCRLHPIDHGMACARRHQSRFLLSIAHVGADGLWHVPRHLRHRARFVLPRPTPLATWHTWEAELSQSEGALVRFRGCCTVRMPLEQKRFSTNLPPSATQTARCCTNAPAVTAPYGEPSQAHRSHGDRVQPRAH